MCEVGRRCTRSREFVVPQRRIFDRIVVYHGRMGKLASFAIVAALCGACSKDSSSGKAEAAKAAPAVAAPATTIPEDPSIDGPSPGAPYQVAEIQKLAVPGRAKWKGQKVKFEGMAKEIKDGTVFLHDLKDEKATIECKLQDGTTPPIPGERAGLEGTVEIVGDRAQLTGCILADC